MPEIGETVLYGSSGACRIDGIVDNSFGKCYVLVPYFLKRTKITVPVANKALTSKMRPVPPESEARENVCRAYRMKPSWIKEEAKRKTAAKEILSGDDEVELLHLIYSYRYEREKTLEAGKKFHVSDENTLKSAEERLCNEYAVIFHIDPSSVPKLIESFHKA